MRILPIMQNYFSSPLKGTQETKHKPSFGYVLDGDEFLKRLDKSEEFSPEEKKKVKFVVDQLTILYDAPDEALKRFDLAKSTMKQGKINVKSDRILFTGFKFKGGADTIDLNSKVHDPDVSQHDLFRILIDHHEDTYMKKEPPREGPILNADGTEFIDEDEDMSFLDDQNPTVWHDWSAM